MKNPIKFFSIAAAAVTASICALALSACADNTVYDDDYKIINSKSLYTVMYRSTQIGSKRSISAKVFTGVDTLYTFDAATGITLSYEAELTSGRLKLVICDDETVINVFECTAESAATSAENEKISLGAGEYRLCLVGDSAEFKISSLTYTVN